MARKARRRITSEAFFRRLRWLDRRPLLDTMEPYRRDLLTRALDTLRPDGVPIYNFVVSGRAKKNWKSTDLVLAGLYCLVIREGGGFILANDEDQAADDLDLAKKLVARNPVLAAELVCLRKEIRRRDESASLKILPAHDVLGSHGKTAAFIGYDEIHGYRNYDLFEALAPDPTRPDALVWVTSYDTIWSAPGIPLSDFKSKGKAGTDPRMLFSWYSGDLCTDPTFAGLEPELRANPSINSWPEGRAYIEQQRQRLPTHKFRRLHLNLPGAPEGAFLDQRTVMSAIVVGRKALPYAEGTKYYAFIDMAGGGADDCTLSIGHRGDDGHIVIDLVEKQAGDAPGYNPLMAVVKFAAIMRSYGIRKLTLDGYAGHTFRHLFESHGFMAEVSTQEKTVFYEDLEVALNAGGVELPDDSKLQEQLLTLVVRGQKVGHLPGDHDDYANACAGVVWLMQREARLAAYEPKSFPLPIWGGVARQVPGGNSFDVTVVGGDFAPGALDAAPQPGPPAIPAAAVDLRATRWDAAGGSSGFTINGQPVGGGPAEPWRPYAEGALGDRWSNRN
jgi:hypothetical protein